MASYFRPVAIAAVLLCSLTVLASADTMTVTNTNDSGPGSLRQALSIANDGDTIDFAVTGTITLTSGELLVNDSITISGPGEGNLAVDGNTDSRVFHVSPGKTVTVSALTIINGNANGDLFPDDSGGGVYNDHTEGTGALLSLGPNSFNNTAIGFMSLRNNTQGDANTAVGSGALFSNRGTQQNTATGAGALFNNLGDNNTANGAFALTLIASAAVISP